MTFVPAYQNEMGKSTLVANKQEAMQMFKNTLLEVMDETGLTRRQIVVDLDQLLRSEGKVGPGSSGDIDPDNHLFSKL